MSAAAEGPARPAGAPPGGPAFRLRILASDLDGLTGKEIPSADGNATIGRSDDSTVVLTDKRISRLHARIERAGAGFRLVDPGSGNGVYVGEGRVQELVLLHGQKFRIVVMQRGKIVQQGTHDEMKDADGPYRDLISHG